MAVGQGAPRSFHAEKASTLLSSLTDIFGEGNPMQVSNTPRPAGNVHAPAEPISKKGTAIAYGWMNRPNQVAGMSVLYVDQINPLPGWGVQGLVKSAINQSSYAPLQHYRAGHWLYDRWDPIFRYANTALDVRFGVGHAAPLTNDQPGNLPASGARMGPYFAPFRVAWQVPRFSTEPNTIIPQPGR